ncbi:hypothetical protein ANCCAN_11395 [Ancylostoma caninum]|uniref:Uncharacterized protein n=1 Tax=Ancylostoma caninum TaxID=29170 RepID=A0A368GHU1_ANCCA|nr:hypothetical protein ANCCAN_11395 [Ancylostoma caninum]
METNDSVLFERAFPTLGRADFESIAHRMQARFNYPRALGFLEGKPVAIKKFHSIMLMACCDCDYNTIAFDVGAPGRAGEAGVFRDSNTKRWIAQSEHLFPETRELGLQILHNLVSRRTDALRDVERYLAYDGSLTALENLALVSGPSSANVARDRMALHYMCCIDNTKRFL